VEGFISAINLADGTLVISGVFVQTDGRTVYEDRDENVLTLSSFSIGDKAEAEGCFKSGGTLLAKKVDLKEESTAGTPTITLTPTPTPGPTGTPFPTPISGNDCKNDTEGLISQIDGTARTMIIGGILVRTDSRTKYEDNLSNLVSFQFFSVGNSAEAKGCFQADGSLLAGKIELQSGSGTPTVTPTPDPSGTPGILNNDCDHQVESFVSAIDYTGKTMVLAGVVVITDERTYYEDRDHNLLDFSTFVLGDKAEAEGCFQTDGTLLAKKIDLKTKAGSTPTPSPTPDPSGTPIPTPTPGNDLTIFGIIDSINLVEGSIVVTGITFLVDESTSIEDRSDVPLTLADLRAGIRITVEGNSVGGGVYQATEIKVSEENTIGGREQHIIGSVTEVSAPVSLAVDGRPVDLTNNPTVQNFDDSIVTLANIGVGDLIDVEGLPLTNGSLRATSIEVRASLLSSIDLPNNRLTASNTDVILTGTTQFADLTGSALTIADLVVGDLIKVEGTFDGTSITALEIKLISTVSFSGPIAGFTATQKSTVGGVATLRSTTNTNAFGFVDLPSNSFANVPNTLYEVRMTIGTDVANRGSVPVARLRSNMGNFQKAQEIIITSTEDGRFSPTLEGKEYITYFVPGRSAALAADWFTALDLLNTIAGDTANAALTMNTIAATPVEFTRLSVVETLAEESFSTSDHGWTNGGAPPSFTSPSFNWNAEAGSLEASSPDHNTFGFWTVNTGAVAKANTLYRGRFLLSSASASKAAVPTIRGRLNLSSFQLGSVTVIDSVGAGDESPLAQAQIHDVYLYIPGTPRAADTILASFDILNVSADNDVNVPVSLEHFTLSGSRSSRDGESPTVLQQQPPPDSLRGRLHIRRQDAGRRYSPVSMRDILSARRFRSPSSSAPASGASVAGFSPGARKRFSSTPCWRVYISW
jgi:hypothetical protein